MGGELVDPVMMERSLEQSLNRNRLAWGLEKV